MTDLQSLATEGYILVIVIVTVQCHKIVGEYEDDFIDAFLAKTIDVKKEMCEEITGDHVHVQSCVHLQNSHTHNI